MRIDAKLKGDDKIIKKLRKLVKTAPEAVTIGMVAGGEFVMSGAVERVPVDTGRLRQTAYVAPPEALGTNDDIVECGFGTAYAIPVHEKTNVSHTHGEAKFLEKAVFNRANKVLSVVARAAERVLLKGGKARPTKFPTRPEEQ